MKVIAIVVGLYLAAVPHLGWCQNLCQLAIGNQERLEIVISEILQLRESLTKNQNQALTPILRKQYSEKLELAIANFGRDFENLLIERSKKKPQKDEQILEQNQRAKEVILTDVVSPEINSESYAPKINELIPSSKYPQASVVRPIPTNLSGHSFEHRTSETALKQIDEYYFITPQKVFSVEPLTKVKSFFGPIKQHTTGVVSQNGRWAALIHPSKIYIWDLSKQNSSTLKLNEADQVVIPKADFDLSNFGALHSILSNGAKWLAVPYYGFLLDLTTGRLVSLKDQVEINAYSGSKFEFATHTESLYFSAQNKLYKLDLSLGLSAKIETLYELTQTTNNGISYFTDFSIHPKQDFIAFSTSASSNIYIFSLGNQHAHPVNPTTQQVQMSILKYSWSEDGRYLISVGNAIAASPHYHSEFMIVDTRNFENRTYFLAHDFHDVYFESVSLSEFTVVGKFKNSSLKRSYKLK